MNTYRRILGAVATAALSLLTCAARGQSTDGRVVFNAATVGYTATYNPKNVAVVWVVDGNNKFVKTLCRHANTRIGYLYKWTASRGTYTAVDGVTSATLSTQPQPHVVTWDCRGTNGQIVADGKYTFCIEYTSANAQGPVCTNYCSFYKGTGNVSSNYANYSNGGGTFTNLSLSFKPYSEIGIVGHSPASGLINTTVPLVVSVSNQTYNAASFTLAVSNLTATASLIGSAFISNLAAQTTTNITVNWNTAGLTNGNYTVRSTVSQLINETNVANNAFSSLVALSQPEAGDIAVVSLSPTTGLANASVSVQIRITNMMASVAGPFTVCLSNVTASASLIATQRVSVLAARASTNVAIVWDTATLPADTYRLFAGAGPLTNETNTADNGLTAAVSLHDAVHDIAIASVSVPPLVPPASTTNIVIAVTNRGDLAESFTAVLADLAPANVVIGSKATNLAAFAGANVSIPWNTTGFALGYHTLQASLPVASGETNVVDNTNVFSVIIANGLSTNALVAPSAVWKYNDSGLDLSGAPWQSTNYEDSTWSSGSAPLGYGLANIATAIGFGGVSTNRYVTTYFRREFTMDAVPLSLTGSMMRAHGAVLYLNGVEIARQNMPDGDLLYTDTANGAVSGAGATNSFGFVVPAGLLATGRNLFAAELHLASPTNTTAGFAVDLRSVAPSVAPTYAFTPSALSPDGPAQAGDAAAVSVAVANSGNTTATCLVLIRDAATGAVLGTATVGPLVPGENTVVRIVLSTFGAATGARTLQALTVSNGVTNLAAVATSAFSLAAPDFTPRKVVAAGSIGGRCNAVAAAGNTAYLGCGATLEAWNVSSLAAPVHTASLRLPGVIEDLVASNGWIYAATGAAGVQIVEAASATQLIHRATYDTTGHARRLALGGTSLFVADTLGGVRVLSVASPATPALSGAFSSGGPAQALAYDAPRLLVLDGQRGLLSLHAANPAAMSVTGSFDRVTAGRALAAVPGAAFVADANGGLLRISVSSPTNLLVATNALLPAAAGLAASGNALYVAAGSQGLIALNASTLETESSADVGDEATGVAVSGTRLFVAAGFAGARVFDITSPFSPTPLGILPTGARGADAVAVGSTLYVAADEGGLQIYRLRDIAVPTWLGAVASVSNSRCLAAAHATLLVGDGLFGLKVFDISSPASPVLKGTYTSPALSHIRRVAISGSRAALTDGKLIHLLSLDNRASPALLASAQPGGFVFDVAAANGEVYAACGGAGLVALRMDALGVDAAVATAGPATGVAIVSNLLTVACGPAGWSTYNIDNAAHPTLVQTVPGRAVYDAAAAGSLVYLADGARTALVASVASPLTPVTSNAFGNLTLALRVRAAAGLLIAPEDEAGLAVFGASPTDINLNGVPDAWEQQIVSASVQTNGPLQSVLDIDVQAVGPNGYTYYQSYLAGLTPTDPNSVLSISAIAPVPGAGGQVTIQWSSVPGKRYTLYKSTDLGSGFAPIPAATGLLASGSLTRFTDAISTARAFYMVVLAP